MWMKRGSVGLLVSHPLLSVPVPCSIRHMVRRSDDTSLHIARTLARAPLRRPAPPALMHFAFALHVH